MTKTDKRIIEIYKVQLKHYFEKGFGEKSDFSNVIITPVLVKTMLDRYFELGGNLDFLDISEDKYNNIFEEIQAC